LAATLIAVGGAERNLGLPPTISRSPVALPPSTIDQAPIDSVSTSIFEAAVERFHAMLQLIARLRHCGRPYAGSGMWRIQERCPLKQSGEMRLVGVLFHR
jgi:hypothetical protein